MTGSKKHTIIVLVVLLLTIPFLNKPVHVDDTFVLHIAQTIIEDPFDPFGGEFDWFGHVDSVWEQTTNPPLVSYWLAPFLSLGKGSEWILHLAYVPFFLMLACGMYRLSRRFLHQPWPAFLVIMLSPSIIVSGNLMRDIPALGLALLGLSLSVEAISDKNKKMGIFGFCLLGLAALTKYSAAVLLIPLTVYLVLRRGNRILIGLTIPAGMMLAWCLFTWIIYGEAHPVYLLLERSSDPGIVWQDKLLSAFTILGSSLYLVPLLIITGFARKQWVLLISSLVFVILLGFGSRSFYGGEPDLQFLFWTLSGGIVFLFANWTSFRALAHDPDQIFLLLWLWIPFLFSVFLVPFQAVRHLLPALPALVILLLRFLEGHKQKSQFRYEGIPRGWLAGILAVQLCIGFLVHAADYEYAATYRSFTNDYQQAENKNQIWFVGHWGWMFYANQAGFKQLHRDGPFPSADDLLIWPEKVHIGDVFSENRQLRQKLELIDSVGYETVYPFRTLSLEARAGFYATIKRRIPYRLDQETHLENIRIYRVTE